MKLLLPLLFLILPVAHAELPEKTTLFEVARHLYRWHMYEGDIDQMVKSNEVVFYVKAVTQNLDEGDQSKVADVILGNTGFGATLKMANYAIPELKLEVKSDRYVVINVFSVEKDPKNDASYTTETVPYQEMVDYLFKTRGELAFPDQAILDKLSAAVREPMREVIEKKKITVDGTPETLHLASISPVANEFWVLWERGQILLRYASEFDLSTENAWKHPDHAITIYDLDEQVVVSLHEVPGSNAYITRDQAGRALFNCMILGKRIEVIPVIRNN